ncbi:class I SAM-dependent methyltransferase [Herbiconiux sp. CPCC 205763]|uniref:Class I SAM-dependent methyltransferase n=1 Tax=Herbiconiux aconitum TaxID=2970913 RepID=A0ABT2GUS9_9MICO|nr:class I SAM-dependent methyltransferase [Herbiconiux aconitum]MCS5719964.1 class I SAM-dependent methyltransferase [Herbiconiux aconitum]
MARDKSFALSFGTEAAAYDRGRPGYPLDAVEWLLSRAATDDGRQPDVVDVGAGTGKFTAELVERAASVTAVEPDAQMRARLSANLPGVVAVAGTAEAIPLGDDSADVVAFAQAWHWVDVDDASREAARVLRPGGVLALIWNIRDDSVDWVARLGEIMGASEAERFASTTPPLGEPLTRDAYAEFHWVNPLSHDELLAMVTSRSYVIAMPATERAAMLDRIEELLRTHPDLVGRDRYDMPYATRVTIAREF